MQEFTLAQIGMQVTALQNFFDQVTLIDPLAQAEVDPATLQATGHADAVPVLNADGRGWQPIFCLRFPAVCCILGFGGPIGPYICAVLPICRRRQQEEN